MGTPFGHWAPNGRRYRIEACEDHRPRSASLAGPTSQAA
jgi:hypothetical protein